VINLDLNLQVPSYFLYSTVFTWLLLPFKLAALVVAPQVLPVLALEYMLLTLLVNWPARSRYLVLLPYFAFVQVLVLPFFGIARWFSLARATGRTGRLTIGHRPQRALWRRGLEALDEPASDVRRAA
jgi:hypothetical protein